MSNKCRAKGGPANCSNPRCPEKRIHFLFTPQRAMPTPPVNAWTEKDTILFKAQSGSKLYGLNNSNSDDDFIIVTPTVKTKKMLNAKQKITGDKDIVTLDFATFTHMATIGVPQVLEIMFSEKYHSDFF